MKTLHGRIVSKRLPRSIWRKISWIVVEVRRQFGAPAAVCFSRSKPSIAHSWTDTGLSHSTVAVKLADAAQILASESLVAARLSDGAYLLCVNLKKLNFKKLITIYDVKKCLEKWFLSWCGSITELWFWKIRQITVVETCWLLWLFQHFCWIQ